MVNTGTIYYLSVEKIKNKLKRTFFHLNFLFAPGSGSRIRFPIRIRIHKVTESGSIIQDRSTVVLNFKWGSKTTANRSKSTNNYRCTGTGTRYEYWYPTVYEIYP
jgi:hypothetical protein